MVTRTENWNCAENATSMDCQLTWTVLNGTWRLNGTNQRAQTTVNNTSHDAVVAAAMDTINHDVQVDVFWGTGGAGGGPIARSQAATRTYYRAEVNPTVPQLQIVRVVNGTGTTIATKAYGLSANTWYTVRLVATGTNPVSLEMFVNGISELSFSDSDAARLQAGSYTGVRGFQNTALAAFDNFTASDVVSTQVLTPTTDTNAGSWTRNPAGGSLASALAEQTEAATIDLASTAFPSTSRFKLSTGQTPQAGDRTFSARVSRDGPSNVAFTVTLREGGGTTVGGGTLRGSLTQTVSADGWTTLSVPITDTIGNYADLYVEIRAAAG